MRIDIHGQQLDVTPALRAYVDTKLARLHRHVEQRFDVRVVLGMEKPRHRAEANVTIGGRTVHADVCAEDMYAAIDLLTDKLDRALVRHKEKRVDHHRGERLAYAEFG